MVDFAYSPKKIIRVMIVLMLVIALSFNNITYVEASDNIGNVSVSLNAPELVTEDGQEYMSYDVVEFGNYPQRDPTGNTKEPIKWRVMEVSESTVLLWADAILDYRVFDNVDNSYKYWDTCDLRNWLMEDFADEAFTMDDKKAISYVDHMVDYPESAEYQVVRDSIFLPDMQELYALNYKNESSGYIKDNRQILYWRYATAYAHLLQIKAGGSPDRLDGYWLRTSGAQKGIYRYVKQDKYDGFNWESVWYDSSIDSPKILLGICPMVYVSKDYLEKNIESKESVVIKPYTEYNPPYANTVWVEDGIKEPRIEKGDNDTSAVVFDIVEMGSYPQSDKSGKTKEPIKWRVMDVSETNAVLMADSILDYSPYNENEERNGIYWGSSDIRNWLNDYFYNNAFTNAEREIIESTSHENGSKLIDSVYKGVTEDRLMLPAYDDICKWMHEGEGKLSEEESSAVIWRYPTAYSYSQYKDKTASDTGGLSYWLGTASNTDGYYMCVTEEEIEGDIRAGYSHINGCTAYLGICPVMVVSRSALGIYQKTGEVKATPVEEIKLPFSEDKEGESGSGNTEVTPGGETGENGSGTDITPGGDAGGTEGQPGTGESGSGTDMTPGGNAGGIEGQPGTGESGSGTDIIPRGNTGESGSSNTDAAPGGETEKKDSIAGTGEGKNTGVDVHTKKEIKDAVLGELTEQIYTGEALRPELALKYDDSTLVKGVDYTVAFTNNVNSGIAYANVTGCGQYSGTASFAFAIQPRVIDGLNTILKGKDGTIYKAVYSGNAIRPKTSFRLPIAVGTDTKRLTPQEGKDYTISYSNNRKIGVATITYRFYGNYTGIVTKEFQIVPGKVTKIKAKKKKTSTVITWKKVKGATGYEILRASQKNGKYKKIARIGNKKKYVDKKSKGKKYYYKVRAFGKNSGVRYYGGDVIVRASK